MFPLWKETFRQIYIYRYWRMNLCRNIFFRFGPKRLRKIHSEYTASNAFRGHPSIMADLIFCSWFTRKWVFGWKDRKWKNRKSKGPLSSKREKGFSFNVATMENRWRDKLAMNSHLNRFIRSAFIMCNGKRRCEELKWTGCRE